MYKPVGYRWVFVRKRNENNEIVQYKAHLVTQGFSQRPEIEYDETYSPIMDAITFRYLISLAISEGLDMRLMDVVIVYLYGSLDANVYMKIPKGFTLPDAITFRYLISLAVSEGLDMRLMDVVTTYLYGSLDANVYMKIPEGFTLPEAMNSKPRSMYSIKLQISLYGLNQSG